MCAGIREPLKGRHRGRLAQAIPASLGFVEQKSPSTAPASLGQVGRRKRSCLGRTWVISNLNTATREGDAVLARQSLR